MDRLAVGRIGGTHGLDGRLKVVSFSGESEHLTKPGPVELRNATSTLEARVEGGEPYGEGALVKFAGYDSPEAARALTGYEIWVPRERAAPRRPGEYYYADLAGCSLYVDGRPVARVAGVSDGGGGDLLEAALPDGGVAFVPFRKEFIGEVDVEARRIELLAPWILE